MCKLRGNGVNPLSNFTKNKIEKHYQELFERIERLGKEKNYNLWMQAKAELFGFTMAMAHVGYTFEKDAHSSENAVS